MAPHRPQGLSVRTANPDLICGDNLAMSQIVTAFAYVLTPVIAPGHSVTEP